MTEVTEANIKEALTSHRKYISPFPKRKTQAKKGIANYEDLREKYESLVEEFSQASFSHEDFLKYALPALIMTKNKQFMKFLDGK